MKYFRFLFLVCSLVGQAQNFKTYEQACADGKTRPYVVYAPKEATSAKKGGKPLVVFLHGAIGSPAIRPNPEKYVAQSPFVGLADKGDCYLLFPFGQKGCTWFDEIGCQMVLDEIAAVKKQYKIDENKVFLAGFSDGASGVYYFSMTYPTDFTGFIALNGSIKVASMLGEDEIYPCNTNEKPFYIVNTYSDTLYPIEQITPTIDFLKTENPNITFRSLAGDHFMGYFDTEEDNLLQFIGSHTRKPLMRIVWETSDYQNPKGIGWLRVKAIDTTSAKAEWHKPQQRVKIYNNKADLGLKFDYNYKGNGLKVAGFKNDTVTAKRIGVKEGDIVITLEKDSVSSPFIPMMYTSKKRAGDPTEITVLRGEERLTFQGYFNTGYPYYLFRRRRPSARIEAEIKDRELYLRSSRITDYEINRKTTPVKIKGGVKDFINKP